MTKTNVKLRRMNRAVNFVAKNEEGNVVSIDGPPALGGEDLGLRPMLQGNVEISWSVDLHAATTPRRHRV